MLNWLKKTISDFVDWLKSTWTDFVDWIRDTITTLVKFFSDLIVNVFKANDPTGDLDRIRDSLLAVRRPFRAEMLPVRVPA